MRNVKINKFRKIYKSFRYLLSKTSLLLMLEVRSSMSFSLHTDQDHMDAYSFLFPGRIYAWSVND